MNLLGANQPVAQALEVVCTANGEEIRQRDRVAERRIEGARIRELAVGEASHVHRADQEGQRGEGEALERLGLEPDVVVVPRVEAVGERAGEPELSRPDLAHRGEDGREVGAAVADDALGAGIAGGAELRADADEGVGAVGGRRHRPLVGADAVELAQHERAEAVAVRPFEEEIDAAGAVEAVRQVLQAAEADVVEDLDLRRAVVAVIAVAQEGGDVAADEGISHLAFEEHLVDQAADLEVEDSFGKEEIEVGKEALEGGLAGLADCLVGAPLATRRALSSRLRRTDRCRRCRRRRRRGLCGGWRGRLVGWRGRGGGPRGGAAGCGRRGEGPWRPAGRSGRRGRGRRQGPEGCCRESPGQDIERSISCETRSRNALLWFGPRAAETTFSSERTRSSTASTPRPPSISALLKRSGTSSSAWR